MLLKTFLWEGQGTQRQDSSPTGTYLYPTAPGHWATQLPCHTGFVGSEGDLGWL